MRILGIESSSLVASVAIVTDDVVTAEYTLNLKKTHSQTLLPMIDQMMGMLEMDLDTVDAIAVSGGPGSFTGLRIGSATGKGLGLALKKPLIHVPTVDAMAYSLYGISHLICPIMDARRNQVYTGIYTFEDHKMQTQLNSCALDIKELAEQLNTLGKELEKQIVFLGDGVAVYKEVLKECLGVPYSFAPAHCNKQRASAVAALGILYAEEGKTVTAAEFQPDYLRKSQAEREREEREKS